MAHNVEKISKLSENLRLWEDANFKENIAALCPSQIDTYFELENLCLYRNKSHKISVDFLTTNEPELLSSFSSNFERIQIYDDLDMGHSNLREIKNPSDFYERFYAKLKVNDHNIQAKPYRSYLDSVKKLQTDYFNPVDQYLKDIEEETHVLDKEYLKVNSIITQLHIDCEAIKIEQEQYTKFLDQIDMTLDIFDQIDNMQERLMDNNGLPLGQDSCLHMLDQIYKDMAFLRNKPNYKDAPLYLAKCWNHAHKLLTTSKNHIFKILDQAFINADLSSSTNNDTMHQLPAPTETFDSDDAYMRLYGKFRAVVCRAKRLVAYLEEHSDVTADKRAGTGDPHRSDITKRSHFSVLPSLGDQLDEYKENLSVLNECRSHYLLKRERLILPIIKNTMDDLFAKHKRDHCHLVRSATSFFSNLCNDEINLYNQLFVIMNPSLSQYLENVCTILTDNLRTRILHINHLETLSELCSVLKNEVGSLPLSENVVDSPGGAIKRADHVFYDAIDRLLGDVRERIIYRTHVYVETDIKGYRPSPGDLAYPDKLKMIKEISDNLLIERPSSVSVITPNHPKSFANGRGSINDLDLSISSPPHNDNHDTRSRTSSFDSHEGDDSMSETESIQSTSTLDSRSNFYRRQNSRRYDRTPSLVSSYISSSTFSRKSNTSSHKSEYPNSPSELYGLWFPTVRRTIVCLSKLNRCLDKSVFQSLSQDVLTACLDSLTHASSMIRGKSTTTDAQLFLIKHLLIIREQIAPFQSKFAHKEISLDFSNIKDAAIKMFQHKYQFLSFSKNNAFLEFVMNGAPGIQERYLDSRKTVDETLKVACQNFVKDSTYSMTGHLEAYITQVKPILLKDGCDHKNDRYNMNGHLNNGGGQGDKSVHLDMSPVEDVSCNSVANQIQTLYRELKDTTRIIKGRLSLYLTNSDTEYILFRPLKLNAQKSFTTIRDLIQHYYTEEEQMIISCPTFEQVSLVLSEAYDDIPAKILSPSVTA